MARHSTPPVTSLASWNAACLGRSIAPTPWPTALATTTFHYEVHATGAHINEEEIGVQDGEAKTMVSYKDLIKVLDLMPNPTTGMTQVTLFTEELGTTAQVSLFNMAGRGHAVVQRPTEPDGPCR